METDIFVLSDDCTFHYKLSDGDYNDIDHGRIKWDDEMWGFE